MTQHALLHPSITAVFIADYEEYWLDFHSIQMIFSWSSVSFWAANFIRWWNHLHIEGEGWAPLTRNLKSTVKSPNFLFDYSFSDCFCYSLALIESCREYADMFSRKTGNTCCHPQEHMTHQYMTKNYSLFHRFSYAFHWLTWLESSDYLAVLKAH